MKIILKEVNFCLMMNDVQIAELLKKMCSVHGTPGNEGVAAEIAAEELRKYMDVSFDALGNVIGRNAAEAPHIFLDAHIDRIGLVVTSITDEGFVKVNSCGGVDARTLEASEVVIFGKKEIYGVVSSIPPHLTKSGENKASEVRDILIDIGMDKETAQKYISASDRVIVKSDFKNLLGTKVSSAALDNRAGVVSLIIACDMLKDKGVNPNLTVAFTVCEETGGAGAKIASFAASADEAIAVDVSFAKAPDVSDEESGIMSKGPMIGFSSVLDYDMSLNLVKLAQRNGISYQREVMGSRTGTNADNISVSGCGIKTGLISIPLRNMHTAVEVVDIDDIKNTASLICEYISERIGKC